MTNYMKIALEMAYRGKALGEVPVGAIIVRRGKVIATAHNEVESANNPLAHAEILAIQRAATFLNTWRLQECIIYVTLEPCIMCMGAILNSRIKRLVYGAGDNQKGAVESQSDFIRDPLFQNIEIYPGILEEECTSLMKEFFRGKRNEINKKSR